MRILEFKTCGVVALAVVLVGTLGATCEILSVPRLPDADNDEIVNIGDSIFAYTGDIYSELEDKAGETWRHYALYGSQMIGGLIGQPIPEQYQEALDDDPNIRVIYMNGGANDVLIQGLLGDPLGCRRCNYWFCPNISRRCKGVIQDVTAESGDLFAQMFEDGVEQVVVLGYYHTGIGILGDMRDFIKATDYGAALAISGIQGSGANIVYIDPRDAFDGMEWLYLQVDGLHPTWWGSRVLANMIWDVIDY